MEYLNPANWVLPTNLELAKYTKKESDDNRKGSIMMFQKHLCSLDVYCYLKSQYGEPNGFANFIRMDRSDNLIHWHYVLIHKTTYIDIMGIGRSVQILINQKLDEKNWVKLVRNFRKSFITHGKAKSEILKNFEKWTLFLNRYLEICQETEIHYSTVSSLQNFKYRLPRLPTNQKYMNKWTEKVNNQSRQFSKLKQSCLILKFLTPVMIESFINLLILILGKKEITNNSEKYDKILRDPIHEKIPDLHNVCDHFIDKVDINSTEYKNFSKIMNNRNWFFHGNTNPNRDKLEIVYFDNKNIPLFKDSNNIHEKYFDSLTELMKPAQLLKEYICAHEFIIYIINLLKKRVRIEIMLMMKSNSLGYFPNEDRFGILFSENITSMNLPDTPTDEYLFS